MYNRSDVLAAGLRCWRVRRSIRQGVCQPVFLTTSASGSAKAIVSRFLVVTAPGSRHCFEYSTASIRQPPARSDEHTSELQSLMRISYAGFCLQQQNIQQI